eukprot:COSAG04_NODE_6364_length_1346_cov_1.323978_1_plen_258_part_10
MGWRGSLSDDPEDHARKKPGDVEAAFEAGFEAGKDEQRTQEEAVLRGAWNEQLNIKGDPSWIFRVLQGVVLATSILFLLTQDDFGALAGLPGRDALVWIGVTSMGCSWFLSVVPLSGVRAAIGPGGALEALGVGTARISIKDEKRLRRVRLVLGAATVFCILLAIFCLAMSAAMPTASGTVRLVFVGTGLTCFTVWPMMISGFLASMYTGSCLCRNAVIKQIHTVRFTNLVNDERKRDELLALQDTVELLSEGWGRGL